MSLIKMSTDKDKYTKLLRLRGIFKQLSQQTWNIRESEKRFFLGNEENEKQLMDVYLYVASEVSKITKMIEEVIHG